MKAPFYKLFTGSLILSGSLLMAGCSSNPYARTNKSYKQQVKQFARTISTIPPINPGEASLQQGDYWVGSTNLSMRKPNFVIIHHTAQNSTEQTLKTFTTPKTQVSAHYVIGRDGKVYHMLSDFLRAWHAGAGKWGNASDINSSSIGIELDNNGFEPFSDAQVKSLLQVLEILKKTHSVPAANFIGHSDIAPGRKVDPNPTFPWKKLAQSGYGLWYDEVLTDSVPENFNTREALRIIGYDIKNMEAAIKSFQIHFIQKKITGILTEEETAILYNLYKKYL
ncbi:MAG TPA: N-acetylmuramoyl-L-alanine amidase [Sphingobacteriaceae bacterium]|nr:N-acetylmuramoyl-L-alanine amidase [Sphingobacteriaceae bacterium]